MINLKVFCQHRTYILVNSCSMSIHSTYTLPGFENISNIYDSKAMNDVKY